MRERERTERRREREESAEGGEDGAAGWSESPLQMSDREGEGARAGGAVGLGRPTTTRAHDDSLETVRPGTATRARHVSGASFAPSEAGTTASSAADQKQKKKKKGALRNLFSRTRTASQGNLAGPAAAAGGGGATTTTSPMKTAGVGAAERDREKVPLSPLSKVSTRDRTPGTPLSSAASTRSGVAAAGAAAGDKRETVVDKGIKISRPKVRASPSPSRACLLLNS